MSITMMDGESDEILEIHSEEPLKSKLIRKGFWLYFFSFLVAPAGYFIKILIARELSLSDIGIFYSILGFISLLSNYNDLGLTESLQYYLPHYLIDKEYSKAKTIIVFTRITQFLSVIVICGLLIVGSNRLAIHYFQSEIAASLLRYFCIYFLAINLLQVLQSIFIATQHVKACGFVEAIRVRLVVFFILCGFLPLSLTTLTIRRIAALFLTTAIGLGIMWRNFGWLFSKYPLTWDRALIKKQRTYGFRVLRGTGIAMLLGQVNLQFSLYFLGSESAAQRVYFLSFISMASIFTNPIISYLFPLLNELYKKDEQKKIAHLYKLLGFFTLGFGIISWILGYYFSESVAILIFGENFRFAGSLFHIFSPFIFTIPLIGIIMQDLASRGKIKQRVVANTIGLCINIFVCVLFMRSLHMVGILYGYIGGNIALIASGGYYLYVNKSRKR